MPLDPLVLASVPAARRRAVEALAARSLVPASVALEPGGKAVTELRGRFDPGRARSPAAAARAVAGAAAPALQLREDALRGKPVIVELGDGRRAVHFPQRVAGLPILGAGVFAEVLADNSVASVVRRASRAKPRVTKARVAKKDAIASARALTGVSGDAQVEATLAVHDPLLLAGEPGGPELVWSVVLPGDGASVHLSISARDGRAVAPPVTIPGVFGGGGLIAEPPVIPRYHVNPATGVPDFVTFRPRGLWIPEAAGGSAVTTALAFFARHPAMFGTGDVPNQLRVERTQADAARPGAVHVVLQQMYGGVPVFGAQLRVHLSPERRITSISGNYVRDVGLVPVAEVGIDAARATADAAITAVRLNRLPARSVPRPIRDRIDLGGTGRPAPIRDFEDLWRDVPVRTRERLQDLRAHGEDAGLWVLPGLLARTGTGRNHLCWRFDYHEADVFVDAQDGRIVYASPNLMTADRLVYDAGGANDVLEPPLVIQNGTAVPGAGASHPDAAVADAFLLTFLSFEAGLGRSSWDGADAAAALVVNANPLVPVCPNAYWDSRRKRAWFCAGTVTADIVVHELTHGVTETTAGLIYLDESGAVNEHYSDVMAVCAAPDAPPAGLPAGTPPPPPTWIYGEGATTSSRDLANPTINNYSQYQQRGSGCTAPLDVLTNTACDMGGVHTNSGIGSLAAVRLADGDGTAAHPGLGRTRLARLFHDTLTTRMHPWATYVDELHSTWEVANDLGTAGTTIPNPTDPATPLAFTTGDPNEVLWAFNTVGLNRQLISGWYEVGAGPGGARGTRIFFEGETMPTGITVADVEIVVSTAFAGQTFWSGRARLSLGQTVVSFPGGVLGARIVNDPRGGAAKDVTVAWFHSGFLPLYFQCSVTPSAPLRTPVEFLSATMSHSAVGVGGRGDETVNAGRTLGGTGDPTIDAVWLELLDDDLEVVATTTPGGDDAVHRYAGGLSYGARITSAAVGTRDESVGVHWWFDVGSACRYRIRYSASGATVVP